MSNVCKPNACKLKVCWQNVSKPNDYQPKGVDPFKTVLLQMQNTKSDSCYTKEKFECNTCDLLQNNSY